MANHIRKHTRHQAIASFDMAGTYEYIVPENYGEVMVSVWGGAGGESGNL